jgi:Putative papain-like cysteine peptidase (DUF1796)
MDALYEGDYIILPIGYDCHPAYMLKQQELRKDSLPFDWLSTKPIMGIRYVYENLATNFDFFLHDLAKNEFGQIYSPNYPYSAFFHHTDLIENSETRDKFAKKCNRFLRYSKEKHCGFLYNISSVDLINEGEAKIFTDSIFDFQKILKPTDKLFIYIRYDESYDENSEFCEAILKEMNFGRAITIGRFNRQKEEFGIWGNESLYESMLSELGVFDFLRGNRIGA